MTNVTSAVKRTKISTSTGMPAIVACAPVDGIVAGPHDAAAGELRDDAEDDRAGGERGDHRVEAGGDDRALEHADGDEQR